MLNSPAADAGADGPAAAFPPAVKALVAYVTAVGGEDAVLAAHAAFLAHRYGAEAAQLVGALDVRALQRGRRAYA